MLPKASKNNCNKGWVILKQEKKKPRSPPLQLSSNISGGEMVLK